MNPRDRLLSTLRGQKADRVPLVLESFHYPSVDDETDPTKREILDRVHPHLHYFHPVQIGRASCRERV